MDMQSRDLDAPGAPLSRRQQWLEASIEITTQLLAPGAPPVQRLTEAARQAALADLAILILPSRNPELLKVHFAAGAHAGEILGEEFPRATAVSGRVMAAGAGAIILDLSQDARYRKGEAKPHWMRFGPVICVPLMAADGARGAMSLLRLRGADVFDNLDLEFATAFANHATLALELTDARAAAQEVALLADRERIARDLHDHVIQRLFAAGLMIDAVVVASAAGPAERLDAARDNIDAAIGALRTAIFGLRGGVTPGGGALRTRVLAISGELGAVLGFDPRVMFAGPLDHIAAAGVLADVEAVLRETLTNIAKHSGAGQCDVLVTGSADRLVLEISDDGVGLGETARRSGLHNLTGRAELRGGAVVVGPAPPGRYGTTREGTSLTWTIPLR